MGIIKLLSKRVAASAAVVIGITLISFLLSFLIPADPVRMLAGRSASPETVESIRHELGLDQPLMAQLQAYFTGLAHFDLGEGRIPRLKAGY